MPRKPLARSSEHYYHVVTRSNHGDWFYLSLEQVWQILLTSLVHANDKHPVNIASFVLMSNHYHLILLTPDANLDLFMYELNKGISLKLRIASKMKNRMFGSRYRGCLIQNNAYLWNAWKYVFQNPLRAKIVPKVEQYPFSSLRFELKELEKRKKCLGYEKENQSIKKIYVEQPQINLNLTLTPIFRITSHHLDGLNTELSPIKLSEVKKCLKRTTWE